MPPVARTYVEALPESRQFGPRLVRQITPQVRRAERHLQPRVVPDTSQFGRRLTAGLRRPLAAAGTLMAGAFAGRAILGGLASTINAARDLGETVNKNNVVFRGNAREVLRWSRNSATAMGMSRQMALSYAGTLGNLFVSMKIGTPVASRMSRKMVELAADLASFNNVNPEEALEALRAGLVGETEPLRRFGINLNDAALRERALSLGLVKTTKTVLPPAARAQAAYSLILEQSATAQGDFARTSGGLANQQRILRARVDNLKASVGNALLPVMTSFVGFLTTRAIPAAGRLGRVFGEAVAGIRRRVGDLGGQLGVTVDLQAIKDRAMGWGRAIVGGFTTGIRTGDWSQLGGILGNALKGAIGNGVTLIGRAFSGVDWNAVGRSIGTRLAGAIAGGGNLIGPLLAAAGGVDWFQVGRRLAGIAVPLAFGFVDALGGAIVNQFRRYPWQSVLAVASIIPLGRVAGVFARVLGRIPLVGPLLRAISGLGRRLEGPVFGVVGAIARFFGRAVERAFPGIGRLIGDRAVGWLFRLDRLFGRFRATGGRLMTGLREGIVGQNGLLTRAVSGVVRLVTFPFRLAGRWLLPRGTALVKGFGQGLAGQYGLVRRGVSFLITRLLIAPFAPAGRWLVNAGRNVVRGLIGGLNAMRSAAGRAASAVVSAIGNAFGRLRNVAAGPFRAAAGLINRFLGGLDSVASKLGVRIPWRIPGFQAGGVAGFSGQRGSRGGFQAGGMVPGQGTGDKILAGLEPGEVVIPNRRRDRRRLFRDRQVRKRLIGSGLDVGGDNAILALRLMQKGGMAARLTGRVGRVQQFMRSVDPLPYIWGGVGPRGYDCSGLASEIVNRLQGARSYVRRFTTGSIGAGVAGLRPGRGTFTIGTTRSTGHMATNLAGYGAEARSTASGIHVGRAARNVLSFARQFYLPQIGGNFIGGGGNFLGAILRRTIEPIFRRMLRRLGGAGGIFGRILAALGGKLVGGLRSRITGEAGFRAGGIVPHRVFDAGGWLPARSTTLATNRTWRPEPVGLDYDRLAQAMAKVRVPVYLDRVEVSRELATGDVWNARRG